MPPKTPLNVIAGADAPAPADTVAAGNALAKANLPAPDTLKRTLRGEIKSRLKEVSGEEFHLQGAAAVELLRSSPVWSRYSTVFLFLSMKSEIDAMPLFKAALKDGKKVFVPKVLGNNLAFFSVSSAEGPWQKGPFGIREPLGATQAESQDFPALVIVPALAFDRNGSRLGKGKGFYDRFFAEIDAEDRQYCAIGLCMDFQVVKSVPTDEKDEKVDYILTKNELFSRIGILKQF